MVGAGVVGLTCAVRLLEAGHRVDVVARDLPLETTSAVAAAIVYPHLALPPDRVTAWATRSYDVFAALSSEVPEAGVRLRQGTEVLRRPGPAPAWTEHVAGPAPARELPPGYAAGWSFVTPVVEMPVYLRWLTARLGELGGTLTRLNLRVLPDGADLVVNCSGLGARLLGADPSVVPVSGQVVRVAQVGLEHWWLDPEGPTYVVPRERDIVIGSVDGEGEWSRTPSPVAAEDILRRAALLVPEVRGAHVLQHKVGLRPVRASVRLERVGRLVHCYGHGGSGVTLSWGCAEELVRVVENA